MDKIYYNGIVRSVDEAKRVYEAIGIEGNKIVFLGTTTEALALEAEEKIDLKGKLVLPGFNEGHMHLCSYAFTKNNVVLTGTGNVEECIDRAKKFLAENPNAKWLYCRGWNDDNFLEKRYPTKDELDQISKDIPILMVRVCGHIGVANTIAVEKIRKLKEAEALKNEIHPEDGRLYEGACQLYYHILEKPDVEYIENLIKYAMKDLNKCGITSCQPDDFSAVPGADWKLIMEGYKNLEEKNEMTVRIYQQCLFERYSEYTEFLQEGNVTGKGGDFYKVGPLKLLADGSLGAHTAALSQAYVGQPENYGILAFSQEEMDKFVETAQKNNMQVATHCIGDKAMLSFLQAVEKAQQKYPGKDNRHGIVHVQITTKDIMERMRDNEVLAYIQPVFIDYDQDIVESCIGRQRMGETYAWKTLNDLGIITIGGSDAPVESFDILDNIYYAVTREKLGGGPEGGWLPEQKVDVDTAVRMFTVNGAISSFSENNKGMLKLGMLADLVILEKDIYDVEPHKIKDVQVEETICDGKVVYRKQA